MQRSQSAKNTKIKSALSYFILHLLMCFVILLNIPPYISENIARKKCFLVYLPSKFFATFEKHDWEIVYCLVCLPQKHFYETKFSGSSRKQYLFNFRMPTFRNLTKKQARFLSLHTFRKLRKQFVLICPLSRNRPTKQYLLV